MTQPSRGRSSRLKKPTLSVTIANIWRTGGIAAQYMQHFMSNPPWGGKAVIEAIQDEVSQHPEFAQGSLLLLDESANDKAGDQSVESLSR